LLVASGDAILLWDVTTGKRLGLPLRHPKMVTHVAIHPDGNRFVTACADGMLRAWDFPTAARGEANHLVDWIEVLTGRKLSDSGALEEIDAAKLVERRVALERRGPEPFHP
jgi:WD40 repeat protein